MNYYVMYAETSVDNYARPGEGIEVLVKACRSSAFQFLDKTDLEVAIDEDNGGLLFPDFMLAGKEGNIPLVSERLYRTLIAANIDNLFYKRVFLTFAPLGIKEIYWLALPPRINCLDFTYLEQNNCLETEDNEYLLPWELQREVRKIKVIESNVGNFKIFKLAGVLNQEIIVNERLKKVLDKHGFENVYFDQL